MERIALVLVGGLIGLLTHLFIDRRGRRKRREEIAKVIISRISFQLQIRKEMEELMCEMLKNNNVEYQQRTLERIEAHTIHFENEAEYKAFLSEMGIFPSHIIMNIMEYYDCLKIFAKDFRNMINNGKIGLWEHSLMLEIRGIECIMLLSKEILMDNTMFNEHKEVLKIYYRKDFMPCDINGNVGVDSRKINGLKKRTEDILKYFKLTKEIK